MSAKPEHGWFLSGLNELQTDSISINAEVRKSQLEARLEEMLQELEVWQFLNMHWGSINHLIGAINDVSELLRKPERITEELQ